MADDGAREGESPDGEEDESSHVSPIPVPWTMDIGSARSPEGEVIGFLDIYTVTGNFTLFHLPEWGETMSNHWHNACVKMRAGRTPSKLIVAQADLSRLDLGGGRPGS